MALTLVRHTQPDIADGVCYGRSDLDVADDFSNAADLAEQRLPHFDMLLTSPLQRCLKLARFISNRRQVNVQIEEDLREIDFGRWEMVPWKHIPQAQIEAWGKDLLNANPYAGESVEALRQRIQGLLMQGTHKNQDVVWVTHAGVIKVAAGLVRKPPTFDWSLSVPFGEMITLDVQ